MALAFLASVGAILALRASSRRSLDRASLTATLVWTLALGAAGGARRGWTGGDVPHAEIPLAARPVVASGRVVEVPVVRPPGPDERDATWTFAIDTGKGTRPLPVRVRVDGDERLARLRSGELVEVRGVLRGAREARNPGELEVPGAARSAATLFVPRPELVRARDHGTAVEAARPPVLGHVIVCARQRIHDLVERLWEPRDRGLVLSLLLGDRRLLPTDLRDRFVSTGTFHFIAISGLHVGVLMLLLARVPLPRRARSLTRLAILVAFAALTGGSASVLRATLMCAIHVLLAIIDRRTRAVDALGWTAAVLIIADPLAAHDLGFQLSFVAVAAILAYADTLRSGGRNAELRRFLPRQRAGHRASAAARLVRFLRRSLLSSVVVSIACNAATTPLVVFHFQRIHPLGPVANLLVYPLILVILLASVTSLALATVLPSLATPTAALVAVAADALDALLGWLASLPGACIRWPRPSGAAVASAYVLLAAACVSPLRRIAIRFAALAVVSLSLSPPAPGGPRVVHLDVDAASAAIIDVPGGGVFVIDAGGSTSFDARRVVDAVLALGTRRVDGVFLSHPHRDHVGALPAMVAQLDVRRAFVPSCFDDTPAGRRVLAGLRLGDVAVARVDRGTRLTAPPGAKLSFDVLFPARGEDLPLARHPNEVSLALRIAIAGRTFLFLGDLEEAGLARLFSGGDDLRADVLVLPHHGRSNARLGELLERVRPEDVVVSGDGDGGARSIAAALRARSIAVWSTWESGAVISEARDGRWTTRSFARSARSETALSAKSQRSRDGRADARHRAP